MVSHGFEGAFRAQRRGEVQNLRTSIRVADMAEAGLAACFQIRCPEAAPEGSIYATVCLDLMYRLTP